MARNVETIEGEIQDTRDAMAWGREHPYAGYCGDDDAREYRLIALEDELKRARCIEEHVDNIVNNLWVPCDWRVTNNGAHIHVYGPDNKARVVLFVNDDGSVRAVTVQGVVDFDNDGGITIEQLTKS